jgi:type IV secretory pathway VirJ component
MGHYRPGWDFDGGLVSNETTTRKATKQAVKDKKVKKMRLLQAQKEEEERLWDEYSTQEDGSNETFVAACAETKNQEKKAMRTQGKRTRRVESSESSGEDSYPVESETKDDREGSLPSTDDEESVVTEPATKKAKGRSTQSDEGKVWLVVIRGDQHLTVIREVTVAQEEYTPSHPMIGKLVPRTM